MKLTLSTRVKSFSTGVTLAEYAIILTLVAVACLGGLALLGDDLRGLLAGILDGTGKGGGTAQLLSPISGKGANVPAMMAPDASLTLDATGKTAGSPAGSTAQTTGGTIVLSNGFNVRLSSYPTDIARSVVTMGANGTTQLLVSSLETMITSMEQSGQIDPAQGAILKKLANQGHVIGEIEKQVEDHILNGAYDPAIVTPLVAEIGWSGEEFPAVAKMRDIFDEAVNAGALNDPVARQAVFIMVEQIANVASGVENMNQDMFSGTASAATMNQSIVNGLYERDGSSDVSLSGLPGFTLASELTHQQSGVICATGNGQDSGTACR